MRHYPEPLDRWGNRKGSPEARAMIRREKLDGVAVHSKYLYLLTILVVILFLIAIAAQSVSWLGVACLGGFISAVGWLDLIVGILIFEDRINDC